MRRSLPQILERHEFGQGNTLLPSTGVVIFPASYISIHLGFFLQLTCVTSVPAENKTKQNNKTNKQKMLSSPPMLWKILQTAFGEGASAVLEPRGKVTHANDDALCQEASYIPSPTLVTRKGGV